MEEEIIKLINTDFEKGGYKLSNTHYENGKSLHSNQYFFAKKFLQNSDNCERLSNLLINKIDELGFNNNITFVCYRTYLGLLLDKTLKKINLENCNYEIIDQENGQYVWQKKPELKQNIVIILPISCTCITYFKIKRYIIDYIDKVYDSAFHYVIKDDFINIFLIYDEFFLKNKENIEIESLVTIDKKIHTIYSKFNWKEVTKSNVKFYKNSEIEDDKYKIKFKIQANPLIKLYSKLFLPEECPLCFPKEMILEEPLFPTHETYETPSMIFDFPNFKMSDESSDFIDLFYEKNKNWNIQLYGNWKVGKSNYINYIRGNVFYQKNKKKILLFFAEKFKQILTNSDEEIIFITAENKNNSVFLEEFSNHEIFNNRRVTILRFQPAFEFIDNFISLHKDLFKNENYKIIYFEEIINAGKTFKLVNDYIKHIRNTSNQSKINGFDFVISLIDRSTQHTYIEILRILESDKGSEDLSKFIVFFTLNAPIIYSEHIGNPLIKRINKLHKLKEYCLMDSLKQTINKEILIKDSKRLPEVEYDNEIDENLNYFPFKNIFSDIHNETFELYKNFNRERYNLLKLYIAHKVNNLLANKELINSIFKSLKNKPLDFIKFIINHIITAEPIINDSFFIDLEQVNSKFRNKEIENEIIGDVVVKILSRPPFIYYKNIYSSIFNYTVFNLDEIVKFYTRDNQNDYMSFKDFRRFKFYIRLSIDLNSNYLISKDFILLLKKYFLNDFEKIISNYTSYAEKLDKKLMNREINDEYYREAKKQIEYRITQINSFFSYLLFCYKDLVSENPYRSIRLEELINSEILLPDLISTSKRDINAALLIRDKYYLFTGIIKAENVHILIDFFDYYSKYFDITNDFHKLKRKLIVTKKNDTVLTNTLSLLNKSRFKNNSNDTKKFYEVRDSLIQTLVNTIYIKEKIRTNFSPSKSTLENELRSILNLIVSTINTEQKKYEYAFFIEYRKKPSSDSGGQNIYTLFSNKNHQQENTILSPNGLIYNFLYGLYDNNNNPKRIQTLMSCVKNEAGKMVSYKNEFFTDDEKMEFEKMYQNDLYNVEKKYGLKFLEKAQMLTLIRLTDFSKIPNLKETPAGEAVLLIYSNEEANVKNYLDFMSNEKIRLLLTLKNELLKYLQKQFDNDAFIELLKKRGTDNYKRSLRHGISEYTNTFLYVSKEIDKNCSLVDFPQNDIINILVNAINGQLLEEKDELTKIENYTKNEIEKIIKLILKSVCFKYALHEKYIVIDLDFDEIKLNTAFVDIILPEILINMKKHSPRDDSRIFKIQYDSKTKKFIFTNRRNKATKDDFHEGGLIMINDIIHKNNIGEIKKNEVGDLFILELKLYQNER